MGTQLAAWMEAWLEDYGDVAVFRMVGKWEIHVGNPSSFAMLGEVTGRFTASGEDLQDVIDEINELILRGE